MIKVLIVEDSRVTREYLTQALGADPEIRVIEAVESGEQALQKLAQKKPDVILMDIHLPGIDGLQTTRKIMESTPVPIVVCTGAETFDAVQTVLQALSAGALTGLKKPRGYGEPGSQGDIESLGKTLKLMAEVKVVRHWNRQPRQACSQFPRVSVTYPASVIAIGASTGGPPVLAKILSALPKDLEVPILLAQHIATGFSAGLAKWLNSCSKLPVRLARNQERPEPGKVYLAPDDYHLKLDEQGRMRLVPEASRPGPRPSVGLLFESVGEFFGDKAIGVLLTGMGSDGAVELKAMAERGALTVAQTEQSCAVFGMPAVAIDLGGAKYILEPCQIADLLSKVVWGGASRCLKEITTQ